MSSDHATTGAPTRHGATPPDDQWDGRAWRRAALRSDLAHAPLRVLLTIEEEFCTWNSGRNVYPAEETIGEVTGMTRTTINGHMKTLRETGWLVLVRDATNRRPAEYRLGYGNHRPIQTSGDPTSKPSRRRETRRLDVGRPNVQTSGLPTQSPLMNPVPNLSLSSPPTEAPETNANRWERERDEVMAKTDPDAFLAAFPNRLGKYGDARLRAIDAYAAVTATGIDHRTIMQTLNADPPSPDEWPDKWLHDIASTLASQAKTDAAEARRSAIADCDRCEADGYITIPSTDGKLQPTSIRCTHPGTPRHAAATGTDDAWAEPPW